MNNTKSKRIGNNSKTRNNRKMVKLNKILQNNDQDRKGKVINNRYIICEIQKYVNIKKSINKASGNKSQNKDNQNFSNLLKTLLKTLINKRTK